MRSAASLAFALSAAAAAIVPPPSVAAWTHYRGSNQDGTYAGSIRTNWSEQAPRILWRTFADPALSSLTIAQGRVFTQARRRAGSEDREFAIALDAATGRELWAANLDLADYPNGGVGSDDGPRSTPVIDGDRVYVFTSYLRLYCLEAATGHEIWHRDFPAEFNASVISWQNAASPVIVGDLVLVNGNAGSSRLFALRKADGTVAWRHHDARMTQATPVAAAIAGRLQVVFFTQSGLVAVAPENGDSLWEFAFPYSTSTAASPVVAGDVVYCSAAYGSGSGAVRVTASGTGATATQLWKKRNEHMNHWATPVAHEGYLYGVYGQSLLSLRCLDLATGTETWRTSQVGSGTIGYGSILKVGGNLLLVLTDSGEIVLVAPSPVEYRELQKFKAVDGKCWNNAAIDEAILYVRSTSQIAAYDLAPPAPTPLVLQPRIAIADGRARLTVRTADGSPIPPARAEAVSLLAADDLATASGAWKTVATGGQVFDGAVVLETEFDSTAPGRFYRTGETP